MVSEIRLFTESTFFEKAQSYQTVLSLRGVVVNITTIEKLNARFLRLNPELALCVDEQEIGRAHV